MSLMGDQGVTNVSLELAQFKTSFLYSDPCNRPYDLCFVSETPIAPFTSSVRDNKVRDPTTYVLLCPNPFDPKP